MFKISSHEMPDNEFGLGLMESVVTLIESGDITFISKSLISKSHYCAK